MSVKVTQNVIKNNNRLIFVATLICGKYLLFRRFACTRTIYSAYIVIFYQECNSSRQKLKKLAGTFVNIEYSWSKRFSVVEYSVTEISTRDIPTKSTRRMMTPGSPHTAAKSTHHLLLARRVNFLVHNNDGEVYMFTRLGF